MTCVRSCLQEHNVDVIRQALTIDAPAGSAVLSLGDAMRQKVGPGCKRSRH